MVHVREREGGMKFFVMRKNDSQGLLAGLVSTFVLQMISNQPANVRRDEHLLLLQLFVQLWEKTDRINFSSSLSSQRSKESSWVSVMQNTNQLLGSIRFGDFFYTNQWFVGGKIDSVKFVYLRLSQT